MVDSTDILAGSTVLRGTTSDPIDAPAIIHRETLLSQLPSTSNHQYVLVCNDDNRILGIVPTREIDRRLKSPNRFERSRWESMPIGAMLTMSIPESQDTDNQLNQWSGEDIQCSAIRENGSLFGLSVDGDLFLSWKRLESLFTDALSDPLTGLMNRLAYERRLREEWNRSHRSGNSIGIVVVDLDNFKEINDTYGHVVGDNVLSHVGRQLELSMRSYDMVARFGGDEFVALCLGCSPGEIEIPIRRLLDSLTNIALPAGNDIVRVTASVGAAVRHDAFDGHLPEDLFVAADQCLYESKRSSSNSWMIEFGEDQSSNPKPLVQRLDSDPKRLTSDVSSSTH
ncbi:MAG: GGDEF domain-containing protein [Fuerstiella sp.]